MSLKSDIGAKAAWKGFSSQTVYIAYRLMILEDEFDMYPENVEDLMLKKNNEVIELIQVKNLSKDLTLSDLNPKENDSFFRRVLNYKANDLKIKIISFGNVGYELEQVIQRKNVKNFIDKMLKYGYTIEDINWIIEHLEIKMESEESLKNKIFLKLKEDFSTSIAVNIIFDCLINYISNLSRNVKMTNSNIWNNKVKDIINDIVSIESMHKQYGKTILNLSEYRTCKSIDVLKKEYRNGIDANPDHIRNNLDIYRKQWIEKIENAYKDNNIIVVRGLSGQGKSSLAYRFLMDNYNEEFIFIIEHINDFKQAQDIISAISGLTRSKLQETIIYIDITPYDTSWKWILDQIQKRNIKIKVLITIREEDYKRANINIGTYDLEEIEIYLKKEEAEELYNIYGSEEFLDFEDAWENFGKNGPFMEFIYMLSEKQTLTDKISNQINNIIENENDADSWLKFLLIVSFAGKDNYKINFESLSKKIATQSFSKMLKNLQKEYLLNIEDDSKYIVSTHALRARIISNILMEKLYVNKTKLIIDVLECVDEYYPTLIVEFLYENTDMANELIEEATKIQYNTWTTYATMIRSMLWLDTYKLYKATKNQIDYGNKICNDFFIMLFIVDITGYLDYDRENSFENLKLFNQEAVEIVKKSINFEQFKVKYYYLDKLLNNISESLVNKSISINEDYSKVGYVLFWLAKRQIYLKNIKINEINYSKLEEILDLMVGLKAQCMDEEYLKLLNKIKSNIIERYNIIELEENDEISVKFINDIGSKSENQKNYFQKVMEVVYCMRRLYYDKSKYNVKLIGTNFLDWCTLPDTEKHLNSSKIPLKWITDINRQLIEMDEFDKRTDSWNSYKNKIDEINELVLEFIIKYSKAMDYFYRNNNISRLSDKTLNDLRNVIILKNKNMNKNPKCAANIYGINNTLNSFNRDDNNKNKDDISVLDNQSKIKEFGISKKFEKFINSIVNFINQRDEAFIAKIKNEEKNIINVSLYNIYESLIAYTDFYFEYKRLFGNSRNNENLYSELKTFSLFWENFVNEQFMNANSKLYDIKLLQKRKEKKFNDCINENLNIYLINEKNPRYYNVDIFKVDEFYSKLYNSFQSVSLTSYDRFLIESFQKENELNIVYSISNKVTLIGANINLKNILYSKNFEEFKKMQIVQKYDKKDFDNGKLIELEDIKYNSLLAIGHIHALKIYYRYIISVNSEIDNASVSCKNVYELWCNSMKLLLENELKEMINSCNIIFKEINKNEKYIEITKMYVKCLSDYIKILDNVVREKSFDNLLDLDELNKILISLINNIVE